MVFAFGGSSGKQFGTDGSAYKLAVSQGHRCTETYPSLVQLKTETDKIRSLKGLKADLKETSRIAELIHRDSNFIGKRVSDATLAVSQSLKKVTVRLEKSRLIKAFPRLKKSNQDLNSECEKAELEIDKSNDEKE